jgi:hypothetical protein
MAYQIRFTALAVAASLMLASHAFAQKSTIEAKVKGPDGKAAAGLTVQLERQDKKAPPIAGRTDGSGHFKNSNLDPGTYKVSILLAGAPPQTEVVTATATKPVLVSIDMKQAGVAAPVKKIYVWVPEATGSHMGGHYEERGAVRKAKGPGADNVENVSAASLQRPLTQSSVPGGGGR